MLFCLERIPKFRCHNLDSIRYPFGGTKIFSYMNILRPANLEANSSTSSTQQSRAPAGPSGVRLNLHTRVPSPFNSMSLTGLCRRGPWGSHPVSFSICYKAFLFLNGYQCSATQSERNLSNLRVYLYFISSPILYIFVFSFSTTKFPSFVIARYSITHIL